MAPHALLLFAVLSLLIPSAISEDDIRVTTDHTTYLGADSPQWPGEVQRFLGIRYAQAPVDTLRWSDPVAFVPDGRTTEAKEFGPACPQFPIVDPMDEDCLFVNVYRPSNTDQSTELKPVAVFMHGGGFEREDSSEFPGDDLVHKGDVIMVGANFRLGALGFMFHPAITENSRSGTSGNYGILDMLSVLRWVRDNIKAFGGDPDNITLHGQSAGAIGIGFLLVIPEAEGLFKRVIMESYTVIQGNSDPSLGPLYWNAVKQETISDLAIDIVDCRRDSNERTLSCLRGLPSDDFLQFSNRDAWDDLFPNTALHVDHHMWGPTEDGVLVTDDPLFLFQEGKFLDVGIMAGTNSQEGTNWETVEFLVNASLAEMRQQLQIDFPMIYQDVIEFYEDHGKDDTPGYHYARASQTDQYLACPIRRMLDIMQEAHPRQALYSFRFNHFSSWRNDGFGPDPRLLIVHTSELPYVFGPLAEGTGAFMELGNDEEQQLHQDVMTYWTNFYKTGDPGIDERGLAKWPLFGPERNTLVLQPELDVIQAYKKDVCDFWDRNTPVSPDAQFGIPDVDVAASAAFSSTTTTVVISFVVVITAALLLGIAWYISRPRGNKTPSKEDEMPYAEMPSIVTGEDN